jgi:UDP-N-acetylmuramoyl-tripeptide--D-alanyl-D-alanine ligase
VKHTLVIDDSYNASPLSMYAALDTFKGLPAERKIAVLGDMLEIGKYTIEAHENIGRRVTDVADVLIAVGERAKFIADAARAAGMNKSRIYSFDTAAEVVQPLTHFMKQGDLVLVKGSHAMGLDVVVRAITAEPVATAEA